MDFTYSELKSQYKALRQTFDYIRVKKDEVIDFYQKQSPKSFTYIGCGSSFCLCQSAELSAKLRLGMPATALASGDLLMNYRHYLRIFADTLIIAPTRSGSTSEVILALETIKSYQATPVLAIICATNSDLAKIADYTLELPWAFDESVCQTRSVTNLYVANLLVLAYLSGDHKLIQEIDVAISAGNDFINENEGKLRKIAEDEWHNAVILADGEMQGIASEGALAFTEIARVPGRYYHLLDVRHGPMVLVNHDTLVIICLSKEGYEYQTALVSDLIAKGATVITYRDIPGDVIPGVKLQITSNLNIDTAAQGIPFIFIAQALAYFKAIHKGVNPDQPEGLEPWIKL